jgi:hypothetical protein
MMNRYNYLIWRRIIIWLVECPTWQIWYSTMEPCFSLWSQFASCLVVSSGKLTPRGALRAPPRPYARPWPWWEDKIAQVTKIDLNKLTLVLATPSLKWAGLASGSRLAPWSRTLWIQVLISVSLNSSEKEWPRQNGPRYNHILITRCRSGWIRQQKNIHRRCTPVSPSRCNCWTTSRKGCNLPRSFLTTPYPQLGWRTGRLPVNIGSGTSMSFHR